MPTGAKKAPNPVATSVMRMVRVVVPFNLIAMTTGVAHVALSYGLQQVWPALGYVLIYGYLGIPLLFAPRVVSWRGLLMPRRTQTVRPPNLVAEPAVG